MTARDPDATIADKLLAAVQAGAPRPEDGGDRAHREGLRTLAYEARRYYFDTETSAATAELGQAHPDVLRHMLPRARSPHKLMLLDYDVPAFVRSGGREPKQDAPQRGAIRIERLHDTEPLYRATPLLVAAPGERDGVDGRVFPRPWASFSPTCVVFNLAGVPAYNPRDEEAIQGCLETMTRLRGVTALDEKGQQYQMPGEAALKVVRHGQVLRSALIGSAYRAAEGATEEEKDWKAQQCEKLVEHARWQWTPEARHYWQGRVLPKNDTVSLMIAESVVEWAGFWRMSVAALALLQAQDFVSEATSYRGGEGKRWTGKNFVRYLEHRRVELKLPRKVAIGRIVRLVAESIPRRQHEVAGHWKHRRGKGSDACDHVFLDHSATRQQCELCGYDRWFIREFVRGDASVGHVTKDRVVVRR